MNVTFRAWLAVPGPWQVRMVNGELFDVTELVASLQASRVMSTVTSNAVASPPE